MKIDWSERFTPHFTRRELGSPDTGEIQFEGDFLERLERLRTDFGESMLVTSGCRTPEHNQRLVDDPRYKAHPHSLHKLENEKWGVDACAVDVSVSDAAYRWRLIGAAKCHGFALGIGRDFLHLDGRAFYLGLKPIAFVY